jgi:hypothetical protein
VSHLLGEKAIDCLVFIGQKQLDGPEATFSADSDRWQALCAKWGEKPVWAKLEELSDRGYIDYGVSVRGGWLTDKGKEKLREWAEAEWSPEVVEKAVRAAGGERG